MKSDGDAMETTEAVPEPSSTQEATLAQAPSQPEPADDAAPGAHLKANGKPLAVDPKTKPKGDLKKPVAKSAGASANNSRPGAASQRGVNDVKSLNNGSAKKISTAAKSSSAAGAVPKRPMGVATVSTAVNSQRKAPEKKPVGQSRAAALPAAPITNGTKLAAVNGSAKTRPASETVRAKTTAPSRPAASSAPKASSSAAAARAGAPASAKTNKPTAGPPKSRPASATSRPTTATSKPPTTATTKTTTVKATPAPSTGKTAVAQPLKTAPAKKDVGRPLSAAAAKKPTAAAAATTRKPETSKPTAFSKINSASKLSTMPKASDPKVSQPQSQPVNSAPKKKPTTTVRFPANNKPPLGRTPPASPVSKPENRTTQSKSGTKPTQAVLPLTVTKKTGAKNTTKPADQEQSVSGGPWATAPAANVPAEKAREAPEFIPQESSLISVPHPVLPAANVPAEIVTEAPPSVPQESSLTASVPDPVVPAANVLPEMATGAPESSSHESSLTVPVPDSISPEENIPAEIATLAPEPIPDESSLTASIQDAASLEGHVPAEMAAEAPEPIPPEPSPTASVPEEAPLSTQVLTPEETCQTQASDPSAPPSCVEAALSQPSDLLEHLVSDASLITMQEQERPPAAEPTSPPVESPPDFFEEPVLTEQSSSTSEAQEMAANTIPHKVPHSSLNEDEDEEEREGSQLISVSEMSGTTQPTEDSRPGSGGPLGGSAWRAGGALLSELDSEEVSGSQQGASELSAPGVLEGTESMDDLGDGSLKGAIDMEGASAGSPDFEKVPDIPANDFEEDEEDDDDRVCDMDVGSERADEPQRPRHDNDVEDDEEDDDDDDDEDVEMASEGVTESGLESYGNADEDDFVEDERLDNLNRVGHPPPPPPLLPSAPAAQWEQPNPLAHPWSEPPQQVQEAADRAAASPPAEPWQADSETPTQAPAQAWLELGLGAFARENQEHFPARDQAQSLEAQVPEGLSAPRVSLSGTLSSRSSTPEEQPQDLQAALFSSNPELNYQDPEKRDGEEDEEAETLPADDILGGPATAPASNPSSSSSASEDEPSDTEGEAHLDGSSDRPIISQVATDQQPASQRCLSTVEEGEEPDIPDMECAVEDTTPPSATSLASYGFDSVTTASTSNALSTGESCIKSPGIFSLEELPDEPKKPGGALQPHLEPCLSEQQYIDCGKQEEESGDRAAEEEETLGPSSTPGIFQLPEENPDDVQPPYYSAICEKTENSFAGLTALPHPRRPDRAACPRNYCDIVRPCGATDSSPKLTFTDLLPPRSLGQQAASPQLCRLEQHQKQLLQLQQSCPLEEAGQERTRKENEEAGQEIKEKKEETLQMREEEEMKQRRDLELQLQQQQEELKQRQQIMQWQQELQQANKGQAVLLSPSSGLCTIYEALESSDEEDDGGRNINKREPRQKAANVEIPDRSESVTSHGDKGQEQSPFSPTPPLPDSPETPNNPSRDGDGSPSGSPATPEEQSPLDLDWGKKVDIVQQLINQTLLLNREGCSSLLLLPGGAGGTLSPLESSLWPSLLPPLTPPSATVTSVSSFSPETTGSSPQEEWTVVELETHH